MSQIWFRKHLKINGNLEKHGLMNISTSQNMVNQCFTIKIPLDNLVHFNEHLWNCMMCVYVASLLIVLVGWWKCFLEFFISINHSSNKTNKDDLLTLKCMISSTWISISWIGPILLHSLSLLCRSQIQWALGGEFYQVATSLAILATKGLFPSMDNIFLNVKKRSKLLK